MTYLTFFVLMPFLAGNVSYRGENTSIHLPIRWLSGWFEQGFIYSYLRICNSSREANGEATADYFVVMNINKGKTKYEQVQNSFAVGVTVPSFIGGFVRDI